MYLIVAGAIHIGTNKEKPVLGGTDIQTHPFDPVALNYR
jgi:hypothetical protein